MDNGRQTPQLRLDRKVPQQLARARDSGCTRWVL